MEDTIFLHEVDSIQTATDLLGSVRRKWNHSDIHITTADEIRVAEVIALISIAKSLEVICDKIRYS